MKRTIIFMILAVVLVHARNFTGVNPDFKIDSVDVKGSAPKSLGAIVWDQLDQQIETGHSAQVFETHVGKQEYGTSAFSSYSDPSYGLKFDVLEPTILKNVSVYPTGPGEVIIRVLDSSGTVLDSVITSVTSADYRLKTPIDLNFFLPPGTGYKIDAKGSIPDFARNTSGVTYPYTSELINITGPSVANSYYYYFYDWRMLAPETSNVGPVDKNIGGGGNYVNYSDGIVFNVEKSSYLKSVYVYPANAGNVTVRLLSSSNEVLNTKTVAVAGGGVKTKIDTGFYITPGTGYKLDAMGTTTGLWRNSSGAIYPYTSDCMTITGAINNISTYYYFFYDIEFLSNSRNKNPYDCEIAADFVLSEQTTIKRFKVKGWFENEVSASHVYKLRFYSNTGSSPSGTALDSAITSLSYPGYEDIAALDLIKPVTLPAGTYWVGFQALTDVARYNTGRVYFSHRGITANSTQAYWRNPLDGYGTGNTGFTAMGYDICFALYSEKGVCGYASGTWNTTGSPYYVDGNILIKDGSLLAIDPGVQIIFRHNYRFNILGQLNSIGSSSSKIIFQPYDQNIGWGGIKIKNEYPDFVMNDNDSTRISNCILRYANSQNQGGSTDSDGGALMIYAFSKVRVSNCLFEHNKAPSRGGAMALTFFSGIIENNTFSENVGFSAIYLSMHQEGTSAIIRNNIFKNNNSIGLESSRNNAHIVGNLFYGNRCGIELSTSKEYQTIIANNTIVGNSGANAGGIIFFDSEGTPVLINNIIYGNTGYGSDQIYIYENECDPVFLNCNVQGGREAFGGDGGGLKYSGQYLYCFDQEPMLNPDYSLSSASPCINMGNSNTTGLELGSLDLFGKARIYGSGEFSDRIDIGASELYGVPDKYRPTTPEFSVMPGNYDSAVPVTISSKPAASAQIYYSLDGSYPNTLYTSSLIINSTKTLRARSYCAGMDSSYISDGTYNIYGDLYSGNVSGTWYKSLSPYYISGDITIPEDSTLTIEPGVQVIFTGHYLFNVEGRVLAVGNQTDSISFRPQNISEGWQGINIYGYGNEPGFNSRFSYCIIEHVNTNASWQAAISVEYQDPIIENSRICKNTTDYGGGILCYRSASVIIRNNNIYGNTVDRDGGAIYLADGDVYAEIVNNYIHKNSAEEGGAIYSECDPLISGNVIYDNYADYGGAMIFNYNGKPKVYNNTIVCNSGKDGGAINLKNYSEPDFINNIIYYNTASRYGSQIFMEEIDYKPQFIHCNLQGGKEGIYIEGGGSFKGNYRYSIDTAPSFLDTLNNNFSLNSNSHCINHGTIYADSLNLGTTDISGYSRIYNGAIDIVDIGAYERQGNPNPFKMVMPEFSPNGGDYSSAIQVNVVKPNSYATAYYTTDGTEPDQTSNVYSAPISITQTTTLKVKVYYSTYEPSYTTTQQYNIYTNSYSGNISGVWYKADTPHYLLGDVEIPNGLTLTIQPGVQVISTGNYKFGVQGRLLAQGIESDSISFTALHPETGWQGIHFDDTSTSNDSTFISFCKFEDGTTKGEMRDGGAFFINNFSKLKILNSSIRRNRVVDYGTGAGIFLNNSSPVISGNLFEHNASYSMGSAITCSSNSNPLIIKNIITENIESAIFCSGSSPKIVNNLINYNEGSGILVYTGSHPEIINNTIVSNSGGSYSSGIEIDGIYGGCNPTIKNTLIYNNSKYQVYISDINCQPEFNYCNIQGGLEGFAGSGANIPDYKYLFNIDSDPKFVSTGSSGFSFRENSPCINAGSPDITGMDIPAKDLSDKNRVFDGYVDIIDIGAYEYNGLGRVEYSGTLSDSIRWVADIVEIANNVSMAGIDSLKIMPGVHIDFKDDYVVQLQDSLIARGTETDKIVIENAKGGFNLNSSSKAVSPSAEIKHWIYAGDDTAQEEIKISGYDNVNIDSCSFTNVTIRITGSPSKAGSSKKITNNSLSMTTAVKGIQKAGIVVDGDFDVIITGNNIANLDTGIVVTSNGIKAPSSKKITNNSLSMTTAIKEKGTTLGILLNNTSVDSIYHNSVYNSDTGIKAVNQVSSVTLINNIFWNNDNQKVQINDPGAKLILKNNDISGTTNYNTGLNSGNINNDPLFVNAVRGDLHINSGSPCKDAGLNIPGKIYYNTTADIGAYEYGLDWSTPYNLAATGGLGVINLTWTSPFSKKGLTGYNVYRDGRFKASTVSPSYNDTAISNNVEYRYHVTAVYSSPAGESAASNSVNFTATTSIIAPTDLTCLNYSDGIMLNWLNGITSKGLIRYNIYRNSVLIDSTVTTQYFDRNVLNLCTYEYSVTSVYEYPDAESPHSGTQTVTVMNPPKSLEAEVSNANVYLSWLPPVQNSLDEGFESSVFPPSGWTTINNDGDSNNWFKHSVAAHSGSSGAISRSYSGVTPDNFLISPLIFIEEGSSLSYYVGDYYTFGDYYSVLVSTSGNDSEDFTYNVYQETISTTVWNQRTIDLSQFEGKCVFVAFRHYNCTNKGYLMLDDIIINTGKINTSLRSYSKNLIKKEGKNIVLRQLLADEENVIKTLQKSSLYIAGYEIFRNGTKISTISDPSKLYFYDNGLVNGSYEYKVKTIYSNLERSAESQAAAVSVTSGAAMLLYESFENVSKSKDELLNVPENWTTIDQDGDNIFWMVLSSEGEAELPDGDYFAYSMGSEMSSTTSNWLISPQLHLSSSGSAAYLKFYFSCETEFISEKFYVKVSTSGNEIGSFTDIIYESPVSKEYGFWHEVNIDLSAYAGQDIYLAWHHLQSGGTALIMDMISVSEFTATSLQTPSNVALSVSSGVVTITWDRIMKDTYLTYIVQSSTDLISWTTEKSGITDTTWSEPLTGSRKFYRIIASDAVPDKKIIDLKTEK
jgi:parallel beta-helix repeat protein